MLYYNIFSGALFVTSTFTLAFSLSLLSTLVSVTGLLTIRYFSRWGRRNSVLFAAFAAGILISAAFLHLIPQALSRATAYGPLFIMAGYLLMYSLGLGFGRKGHAAHEEQRAIAFIPIAGIAVHSLIDGFVYSSAFSIDTYTGIIAVSGLLLHEFPESIIAYVLLLRGGLSERRAMVIAFLAASVTTPLGMLISYPFIGQLTGEPLGWMLAISAGVLVYVSASHLVPHVEHEKQKGSVRAFGLGILCSLPVHLLHVL